jgi:hypothetical protein
MGGRTEGVPEMAKLYGRLCDLSPCGFCTEPTDENPCCCLKMWEIVTRAAAMALEEVGERELAAELVRLVRAEGGEVDWIVEF